jgi:hypothetical protein
MITPDRKVRKLMEEYEKTGNVSKSALRADMDRKTAGKYLSCGKLNSLSRDATVLLWNNIAIRAARRLVVRVSNQRAMEPTCTNQISRGRNSVQVARISKEFCLRH